MTGTRDRRAIESGHLDIKPPGNDEPAARFVEIRIELAARWDSGLELVSRDAETFGEYPELLEPIETGDKAFDEQFRIEVQLPDFLESVLLSDDVQSLLRRLDDQTKRLRIADGQLQLRYERTAFDDPAGWLEAIDRAIDAADRLDDALDDPGRRRG